MQHKRILAAVAVLSLAACTPAATVPSGDDDVPFGEATSSAPAAMEDDVRVIDVLVTDWAFTPATITAKQGEKVQLRLTGDKGIHGFQVADLGLNVRVQSGEVTAVDLPTDKVGTFAGRCNVPCGAGHRAMTFTIVVE